MKDKQINRLLRMMNEVEKSVADFIDISFFEEYSNYSHGGETDTVWQDVIIMAITKIKNQNKKEN